MVVVGAMTAYVTVYVKRVDKKVDATAIDTKAARTELGVIHTQINGVKDELVRKASEAGELRGKIMGRDEVLKDIADEKPFVIFLDDNKQDLEIIAAELARVGIKKYLMYNDYNVFLNNLTRICSVYIIDKGLPGSSGLAMINQIMTRNPNNFIILLTGDMDTESQRACQNAGATKTVIKNTDNSYLNDLCKFIDEGITAVRLRR